MAGMDEPLPEITVEVLATPDDRPAPRIPRNYTPILAAVVVLLVLAGLVVAVIASRSEGSAPVASTPSTIAPLEACRTGYTGLVRAQDADHVRARQVQVIVDLLHDNATTGQQLDDALNVKSAADSDQIPLIRSYNELRDQCAQASPACAKAVQDERAWVNEGTGTGNAYSSFAAITRIRPENNGGKPLWNDQSEQAWREFVKADAEQTTAWNTADASFKACIGSTATSS